MRRRTLLRRVGVGAGAVALAGCLDGIDDEVADETGSDGTESSDEDSDGSDDPDDDQTESSDEDSNGSDDDPTESTKIVAESIESEGTCATGSEADSEATVLVGDGEIGIAGSLEAPNPCHEAVLETVELVEADLEIIVDVEPEDVDVCNECLARIDYDVTIEFEGPAPRTVTVSHATIADEDDQVEEAETKELLDDE